MKPKISIIWLRRDLRLTDNMALYNALERHENVLALFIFDNEVTDDLLPNDHRITFIYNTISEINTALAEYASSLLCLKGNTLDIWGKLCETYTISDVYVNEDYEPYGISCDKEIGDFLATKNIGMHIFKDHVISAKDDILKSDLTPYVVYTPYKNRWWQQFESVLHYKILECKYHHFYHCKYELVPLEELGFVRSKIEIKPYSIDRISEYEKLRDYPAHDVGSNVGPHLRFGTVSIRQLISSAQSSECFINELVWREFFMQIMYHFPQVVGNNFRTKYDNVKWRNNNEEFELWTRGETGFPIIDAGMKQLNATGYMHNRVRMLTAGFLCKDLLIDWRWGEAYFAQKLFDYELSSNNGNWQWAAGTGCDAAPYFRVFNPMTQQKKFDPNMAYIKTWIPNYDNGNYINPIVDHTEARKRALNAYKSI